MCALILVSKYSNIFDDEPAFFFTRETNEEEIIKKLIPRTYLGVILIL